MARLLRLASLYQPLRNSLLHPHPLLLIKGAKGRDGFNFFILGAETFAPMALPAFASLAELSGVPWSGSELVCGELDAMSSIGFIPPWTCCPWRVPGIEEVPHPQIGRAHV